MVTVNHMPPEWQPHSACLLLYPHNPATFRLPQAREEFHRLIQTIIHEGNEDVVVFCCNQDDQDHLLQAMRLRGIETVPLSFNHDEKGNIWNRKQDTLHHTEQKPYIYAYPNLPSHDTWARDTFPTFVRLPTGLIGLDWDFNAYGGPQDGCYWPCHHDQQLASKCCQILNIPNQKVPLVLEGGSIHVDGEGTLLTTRECLLHPNRNPHLSQQDIERMVCEATGCTKVIWLPQGLAHDDDTNGHIDNFACFAAPQHVVLAWTDDETSDSDNYTRCRQALTIFEQETDAKGRPLHVHKLMLPPPMHYTEDESKALSSGAVAETYMAPRQVGDRLAASYVNFYIANEAILVPQFGCTETDDFALCVLQGLFPTRKAIGIPSRDILIGGGNIHCITQQLPKL